MRPLRWTVLSACCFSATITGVAGCSSDAPAAAGAGTAGSGGELTGTAGSMGGQSPLAGAGTGGAPGGTGTMPTSGGAGTGGGGMGPAPACHDVLPGTTQLLPTPPMGWSSAGRGCDDVDENLLEQAADALVDSGLRDKGYQYVIVDDCWQGARAGDGSIGADAKFPSGLAGLASYLHDRQLKLGVGTSRGPTTCGGKPGSEGHEAADVASYAAAGVDYVSISNCNGDPADDTRKSEFTTLLNALAAKSIASGIEPYPEGQDIEGFQQWMASAQVYRNRGGISDSWSSFVANVDSNADGVAYTRTGSFNDPGFLEAGHGGMTETEYRAQMSLAAVMGAPLFATGTLPNASASTLAVLGNEDVIAVDQDPLALSGFRVGVGGAYGGGIEVWSKPLSGCGERAVAFFNRNDSQKDIAVTWADLGLAPGDASVRDLWAHSELGAKTDGLIVPVQPHAAVLFKITGTEAAAPSGTKFLSDLPWLYAANSVGPAERDLSNKERKAKDGTPLSIAGKKYEKGLGVHAASLVAYRLDGNCTSFTSDVGVDDEATEIASVVFQVWVDGEKLYDSGLMKGKQPAKSLSVDVTGKRELWLFVDNGGDDRHQDHIDWAGAQLACK